MIKEQEEEDDQSVTGQVKGGRRSGPYRSYRTLFWHKCESNWEKVLSQEEMKISYGPPETRNHSTIGKYKAVNSCTEMHEGLFSLPVIAPSSTWHNSAWLVASPLGRKEKSGMCVQHSCSLEGCPREWCMSHLSWSADAQSGSLGTAESKGEHGQLVALSEPAVPQTRGSQFSKTRRGHSAGDFAHKRERGEGSTCVQCSDILENCRRELLFFCLYKNM